MAGMLSAAAYELGIIRAAEIFGRDDLPKVEVGNSHVPECCAEERVVVQPFGVEEEPVGHPEIDRAVPFADVSGERDRPAHFGGPQESLIVDSRVDTLTVGGLAAPELGGFEIMDDSENYLAEGTSEVGNPYEAGGALNSFVRRLIPPVTALSLSLGGCTGTSSSIEAWSFSPPDRQAPDGRVVPDGEGPVPDVGVDADSRVNPPPDPDGGGPPPPDTTDPSDSIDEAVEHACTKAEECNPEVFEEKLDTVEDCENETKNQIRYTLSDLERVYGAFCAQAAKEWLQCHLGAMRCGGGKKPSLRPYVGYLAADVFEELGSAGNCREKRPQFYSDDC